MAAVLDLADIQGNILSAYAVQGFLKGRFLTLNIADAEAGQNFVNALLPTVTTALSAAGNGVPQPKVTVNIAFSFMGLLALGIPTRTLGRMPDEFIDGMRKRAPMLGDDFHEDWTSKWDEVWTKTKPGSVSDEHTIHMLVTLNAQMNPDGTAVPELDQKTEEINRLCSPGGVTILDGHNLPKRQPVLRYQDLSVLTVPRSNGTVEVLPTEHFGFRDFIGDPVFEGQPDGKPVNGNGAFDGAGHWRPLKAGEFLLGYPDEAQEIAGAAMPLDFSRNGTFMAYRKLHQNVVEFHNYMDETAKRFGAVFGIDNPQDRLETLKAKIAGRWSDGVPLSLAPTADEWRKFNETYRGKPTDRERAISDFTFHDDPQGTKCPIASHMRRVNTRDSLAPSGKEGSVLNNRRRVIRRGLPYGDGSADLPDTTDRGVVMLVLCASLFRQFEFVQQQWINYGLDANVGNDTCPLVGNHADGTNGPKAKFVIPSDPSTGRPPFIMEGIPQFVETRGGGYFFIPSMTALRMIGMGVVDPT